MAFGRKRTRRKSGRGLAGIAKRREKRAEVLEAEQRAWKKFKRSHAKFAKAIEEIREKAANGYQRPKSEYELKDHLFDIYELLLDANAEERKAMLRELDKIYSRRSNATRYLALLRAASVPGYDSKKLSKSAGSIKKAIRERVPLDEFEDHRKKA
jgi:hypothetical protein